MDKKHSWNAGYWLLALALLWLLQNMWQEAKHVELVAYSEFEQALGAGRIDNITVMDNTLVGHLKTPDGSKTTLTAIKVEPDMAARLQPFNVPFSRLHESTWLRDIASWVLPTLVFMGIWFFLFRNFAAKQGLGGLLPVGKSHAKIYAQTSTGVTFANVAGVDEARHELEEVVDFLKHPKEYGRLGAHIPKGVLLVGPPGTGKTLLARAVAGEANVPFFSISGSEFVEMFVGVGAARVRDLFEQARTTAPAIIFIDELDALGRARGAFGALGGHDEKEQTLNQLLSEMDGFDASVGLIILSATNRPEVLDPAVRLDEVAALTPGFSGADLANLVNEATLAATRRKAESVALIDFTAAVERVVAGLERKSRVLNATERQAVACHEMGHALVALAQKGADPVHKVSIIPRGIGALGYTIQRPTEDRYLTTQAELQQKMAVLLAGRAAEKLVFHSLSTGAVDDLAKATSMARDMVMRYGMDEGLGYVAFEPLRNRMLDLPEGMLAQPGTPVSQETQRAIDQAIRAVVMDGFARATAILQANRAVLERGAQALLEHETLDEAALRALAVDLVPVPAEQVPSA